MGVKNLNKLVQGEKELRKDLDKIRRSKEYKDLTPAQRRSYEVEMKLGSVTAAQNLTLTEKNTVMMERRKDSVHVMRQWLGDVVIRRTDQSKKADGTLLSGLDPPIITMIKARMGEEESAKFKEIANRTRKSKYVLTFVHCRLPTRLTFV